jgi:predicted aspartyl protease
VRWAAPVLALLFTACSALERSGPTDRYRTEIPAREVAFRLHRRAVPSIDGEIPGHGTGEFILDTGARHTIVDKRRAERFGLPLFDYARPLKVTRGGAAAGALEQFTRFARLELGSLCVLDCEPPVAELSHVQRRLAGLIGQDVLRGLGVVFDGPKRQVRFVPSDELETSLASLRAEGVELERLPVTWWNGVPTVEIHCGQGVHAKMVLDTGASMTSLPRAAIEAMGLAVLGTTSRAHIGGMESAPVYRCEGLQLGRWPAPTWVDDHSGARGLLGYDVLRRFVVVLDGPRGELWIGKR